MVFTLHRDIMSGRSRCRFSLEGTVLPPMNITHTALSQSSGDGGRICRTFNVSCGMIATFPKLKPWEVWKSLNTWCSGPPQVDSVFFSEYECVTFEERHAETNWI